MERGVGTKYPLFIIHSTGRGDCPLSSEETTLLPPLPPPPTLWRSNGTDDWFSEINFNWWQSHRRGDDGRLSWTVEIEGRTAAEFRLRNTTAAAFLLCPEDGDDWTKGKLKGNTCHHTTDIYAHIKELLLLLSFGVGGGGGAVHKNLIPLIMLTRGKAAPEFSSSSLPLLLSMWYGLLLAV